MGLAGDYSLQDATSRAGRSKYRAVRVRAYGRLWASQAECRRYGELLTLGNLGLIRNLEIQPRYRLESAGLHVAIYVADFAYDTTMGWPEWTLPSQRVVEDVKGVRTPLYQLKRKLFQSQYPEIVFREVR